MIAKFDFYGSEVSFSEIISRIKNYLREILQESIRVSRRKTGVTLSSLKSEIDIEVNYPSPSRNIEYYQHGLKRMTVSLKSGKNNNGLYKYIENLSNIFTSEEEKRLAEYTPLLRNLITGNYFDKQILSNSLVIFREHSLISVNNIFALFKEMGLKPENSIYYSKGDRCRNIVRIEASFKDKGYGVFILSPFESVSPTGKSEDEKIIPEAKDRVYKELNPYFKKARRDNLKIVIFDDGGLMVTTIVDLFQKEYGDIIYGYIETTKGGMHAIKARPDMQTTILNLADCYIKNLLNTVIGHSIVQRLREMIPQVGLRGQSVVVVGYGTLGRAISKDLRRLGMSVYVCDIENEKIFEAMSDGFPVSKDAAYLIEEFKPILIMGCTGLDALTYDNLSRIKRDTYVATVSSNEIKQSYSKFDKICKLELVDNYARIYTLSNNNKLVILGNGASLNLYNGEGANHSEYQPFLAAMVETIAYSIVNGPIRSCNGLDTTLADKIISNANILGKYLKLSNSLLGRSRSELH